MKEVVLLPTAKIVWSGLLLGIDLMWVVPSKAMMVAVLAMILLDFITGVMKAKLKGEARTSAGYRKTVIKVSQYVVPVLLLWGLSWHAQKNAPQYYDMLRQITGFVMLFIIYIEVTSVMENLYQIDSKSTIAKYLYRPALKILKFGIENNPAVQAAKKLEKEQKAAPAEKKDEVNL